ncbi:MAG: helix-turn-helix transcriptional regulator [Cyanobacteria bacterium P01_F01_bin.150]
MLELNRNNHTCASAYTSTSVSRCTSTRITQAASNMPLNTMISTSISPNPLTLPPTFNWLQIMMEGHMDGMVLLTEEGQWVTANRIAKEMCDRLAPTTASPFSRSGSKLPKEIQRCCQHLINSRQTYPDKILILDSEITTDDGFTLRVRVQWFWPQEINADALGHEDHSPHQYILVILEDQERSNRNRALFEAQQFGLSPREREVWLLRRTNHAMQDIADTLVISLNTVKKHLKSIHFKQRTATLLDS